MTTTPAAEEVSGISSGKISDHHNRFQNASADFLKRVCGSVLFQVIFFLVFSFLEFVTLELFFKVSVLDYSFVIILKNVLIIAFLNLFLVGLFHSLKLPLMISVLLFTLIGAANYFVIAFRGYGIVFLDLYAVKTAAGVAGGYNYSVEWHFIAAVVTNLILFMICFLLPRRKHAYRNPRFMLISLLGMAASALFFFWIGSDTIFFRNVSHLTWDHNIGMNKYGYVLYFTANGGKVTVKKPSGYSVEKVDRILSRYEESDVPERTTQNPNLIIIMNESFADLNVLGRVATNKEVFSFYNSLTENTIKGYAESSVYGGYTANSEFEFLTGCTKAYLPGNPYLQYLDDYIPSLITNLKKQAGYREAIAVHPYYPSGYNRNRAYPLLGFDKFLSLEDFGNDDPVRKFVGDLENYKKIEELFEQKEEGSSLCVFNVTMQNHSSYDDLSYKFENPISVMNFSTTASVNQYLSLLKMSDDALKQLITYFNNVDEPTVIVFFGDHQPHLPDGFYKEVMGQVPDLFTREQMMQKYVVPFFIWANYDIPEQEVERVSLNYLSSLMLQTAGLKLSNFNRYLLDLHKKLPSVSANGYYDSEGKLHDYSEEDAENQRLLEEYEMVQYHYLFDRENRLEKHFTIGQ